MLIWIILVQTYDLLFAGYSSNLHATNLNCIVLNEPVHLNEHQIQGHFSHRVVKHKVLVLKVNLVPSSLAAGALVAGALDVVWLMVHGDYQGLWVA